MSILATQEKRLLLVDDGGHEITVGEAKQYILRYIARIKLLEVATRGAVGLGRITPETESLGWRFHAKEFKEFVKDLPEEEADEVVILFGVDASAIAPANHVIVTTGRKIPDLELHLPAFDAEDANTFGYEYGSSCCNGVSIDQCFLNLTQKLNT